MLFDNVDKSAETYEYLRHHDRVEKKWRFDKKYIPVIKKMELSKKEKTKLLEDRIMFFEILESMEKPCDDHEFWLVLQLSKEWLDYIMTTGSSDMNKMEFVTSILIPISTKHITNLNRFHDYAFTIAECKDSRYVYSEVIASFKYSINESFQKDLIEHPQVSNYLNHDD